MTDFNSVRRVVASRCMAPPVPTIANLRLRGAVQEHLRRNNKGNSIFAAGKAVQRAVTAARLDRAINREF
jgi:hypothetical protein